MTDRLLALSDRDLRELALALQSGRLVPPYSTMALERVLAVANAATVADELQALTAAGFGPAQIFITIDLLRAQRDRRPTLDRLLELVVTGPDVDGVATRDTSVVVRDLFVNAREDVLVAGYAVYQGQQVFQALADRMAEIPELQVRLFLDIQRPHGDTTTAAQLVRRFAERFTTQQWPSNRPLPELYYDTRSLALDTEKCACLHAKVAIVDRREIFISSANFTEAAQHRNLEVGVSFESGMLAQQLLAVFNRLIQAGVLARVRLSCQP